MKTLLGTSTICLDPGEVNMNIFLNIIEFEINQLKLRFPDYTEIAGKWKGKSTEKKYVIYCFKNKGSKNALNSFNLRRKEMKNEVHYVEDGFFVFYDIKKDQIFIRHAFDLPNIRLLLNQIIYLGPL